MTGPTPGLMSRSTPTAFSGTTMSLERMAASVRCRRTGWRVISATRSGVAQASSIGMPSRTRRYSGSDRPAWRMNHTGVCGTGSRRQARRTAESRSASAGAGAAVVTGADGVTLAAMIFITAKFRVRPEHADAWPAISAPFTAATRAEPGCLWFDWSRSLDDASEYVLVEAFRDGDAGAAHVRSGHFATATSTLPKYLVETPRIVSQTVDQDGWSELGEM